MASSRRRATSAGAGFRIYVDPSAGKLSSEGKDQQFGGIQSSSSQSLLHHPPPADANNDLTRAAALLLANVSALSLPDLCPACSCTLLDRLSHIASGKHLNASPSADLDEKSSMHTFGSAESNKAHEIHVTESVLKDQAESVKDKKASQAHASSNSVDELVSKMASQSFSNHAKTEAKEVKTAGHMLENVNESMQIQQVKRKKDFVLYERVNGILVNVVEGLELHMNIFNDSEQQELIDCIYHLQEQGRNQMLRKRTYSEPRKWMRGKGRVTIQFGCCYNYAVDKDGNPPGIIRDEEVDRMPEVFRMVIKRLVRWHVLPTNCVPDSCIVNIYDVGDCIPPHIDHHDFLRPFCTISLLSECNIIFGSNLKILGPGEFQGSLSVPLPVGSVLILNGNGADVAKHAVPAVPTKRISITFRKMDPAKVPQGFKPDQELLSFEPFRSARHFKPMSQNSQVQTKAALQRPDQKQTSEASLFSLDSDFPPLGS